jgi:hypothetical protein
MLTYTSYQIYVDQDHKYMGLKDAQPLRDSSMYSDLDVNTVLCVTLLVSLCLSCTIA